MTKLKVNSKLNKTVEEAIEAINSLPYSPKVRYKAARRYNDRIYKIKNKSKFKKCQKKQK